MSDIEIIEESEVIKICYKYKERLLGNLNIVYNEQNSMFLLWNKYQIFLHEDLNFDNVARVFVLEFQIRQLIVSNNYLVCIDFTGNVHVTSLKFKHSGQKKLKSSFQAREQGIVHSIKYTSDTALSLKLDLNTFFLCIHKINADFQLEKKMALIMEKEDWPLNSNRGKYILNSHKLSKEEFEYFKDLFQIQDNIWKDYNIVLVTFDKFTVYGCVFSQKSADDVIKLIKLYTSPIEICDLIFNEDKCLNVLVPLTTGTLIQLQLENAKTSPNVCPIHLNTALSKIMTLKCKDTFIYTDGLTMWKSENTFSKENIEFKQLFVRDVKDFLRHGDQLICTTFTNIIYVFSIESTDSYFKVDDKEYCKAEILLNNTEYLYRIMQEIERSKEIIEKVNQEVNYVTALSLSKRQDVMDNVTQQHIEVYENYEEVLQNNSDLTLTEDLSEYFKPEALLFLIKITTSVIQHVLSHIVLNLLKDLTIHITLLSEEKVLKTTSIKLNESLKKINILVPLHKHNITQINVDIKLITNIPGALDDNQAIKTILHRKQIVLNAEHFIRTSMVTNKHRYLRDRKETIEELIRKTAENQHGDLFKIKDVNSENNTTELPFYVNLPKNYKEILKDEKKYKQYFNTQRAIALHRYLTNEEFLRSKSGITLEIGTTKVVIEILNDEFCAPMIKVLSNDVVVAFDIRNFFAKIFYDDVKEFVPGKEFVSNALYTTTENLQKAMKKCIIENSEDIIVLAEQFQKNVIGSLPM